MKKVLGVFFAISLCAFLTGCNSTTSDGVVEDNQETEETNYTYDTGFPSVELTEYVPEPSFGTIYYYSYDDSITIYVDDASAEEVDEYISSLDSYGWNLNVSDENSDNSFFASNEYDQNIYVNYYDTTMTISVY